MIGGTDIHIELPAGAPAIDFAVRAIRYFWPKAVFENANSAESAGEYSKLDFSNLSEVMAYRDAESAKASDRLGADPSLDGTMIHILGSASELTIVVDSHPSDEIQTIVAAIKNGLMTNAALGLRLKDAA